MNATRTQSALAALEGMLPTLSKENRSRVAAWAAENVATEMDRALQQLALEHVRLLAEFDGTTDVDFIQAVQSISEGKMTENDLEIINLRRLENAPVNEPK